MQILQRIHFTGRGKKGGVQQHPFHILSHTALRGRRFLFAPRADGSDGKLNICVMSHSTRIKLIPVLLSALIGRRRPKGVRTYECREVSIHTEAALPVHADGESCGFQTDIQASCIARKVRMMI